jgi:Cu(I)/Ag(I) efflux system membrane fusion protein
MNRKGIVTLVLLIILVLTGYFVYPKLFPSSNATSGQGKNGRKILYWTDPMLPGDRSDRPGKSPMGMERTPVYADQAESSAASSLDEKAYYTCPMHPFVHKDRPGACPVCGMALVKKTQAQVASAKEISNLQRVSLSPTQQVIANVATAEVSRNDVDKEISVVGVVDFAEPLQAKVAARFDGRIEKLYVNFTGAHVQKGDPLFELHSPDLISAEQELILAITAAKDSMTSDPNQQQLLEATRERLHVHFGMTHEQITELEKAHTVTETMTFRSPISGTVISKDVQEGQYVSEGMLLYQLADLSRVWVYLDVYERDVPFIKLDHPVRTTAESYPNKVFTGRVTFIDPVINPETRTVRVRTEFANPNGELKPQMYVRAQIHVPSRNTLTIPASAVMYTGKENIVWVEVEQNTFEPRAVDLGIISGQSVEVLSGLKQGEKVVSSGGFMIESESQLRQPAADTAGGRQHGSGNSGDGKNTESDTGHMPTSEVDGKYIPSVVYAEQGVPLTLASERNDDSKCTDKVVLKDFGIRGKLPVHQVTKIDIIPSRPGEFTFVCGEGMGLITNQAPREKESIAL